jgi:Spy/CpxP family protein refolding chaperone
MKKVMTIGAVFLMTILAAQVSAQMRMRGDYGRGHYNVLDITKLSGLNLTSAQIKQLSALRDNHLQDIQPIRDSMYGRSMELKGLWLEQAPDHSKIAKLQKEIQTLRNKMFEKIANYRLSTQSILTVQQQTVLEAYIARHGYGFGGGLRMPGGMRRLDSK